jgi:glycosyltransferase involved in cell wall biosynthesis
LKSLGHDVEVVALAKKDVRSDSNQNIQDADGIRIHRAVWGPLLEELSDLCLIAPYSHYVLKCSLALWQRFLKVHQENPFDIVEAPEHLAEAILPALTKVCPLVIRLHTPHSKFVQQGYHNLVPSFDLHMVANFERVAMLEADVLSSPSVDLANYVAHDCGYNPQDIEIVRNPVDTSRFAPDGPRAIESSGKPIVFFAGRLEERKGIYDLIRAVPLVRAHVPNARFVIVGADTNTARGETSVLEELKSSLKATGTLEAVEFIGAVPLAGMPDYYRCADICVVPSLYDNAPYTVLEAMACGKPIVGSSAGGIPEYIVHDETGLIVPIANSNKLAEAITSLLLDAPRRQAFAESARSRIMEHFSLEIIARQAVSTYELAMKRWQATRDSGLYRKSPESALEDFVTQIYSCNEALSDLVYQHSLKLNCRRWQQLLSHRPKLALAKMVLGTMKLGEKIPVVGSAAINVSRRLEAGVAAKEREAEEKTRQVLFYSFGLPVPAHDTVKR